MALPIMAKATAVWLVDNTTLTFKQIADFCGLHDLEVQGIADGDVAAGVKGFDPFHPELSDGQVSKLVGTTKPTINAIRERTHWNIQNIQPIDPVALGLCKQSELDLAVQKANAKKAKDGDVMSDDERRKLVSTEQSLGVVEEPALPSSMAGLESFTLSEAPADDDAEEELLVDADSLFNLPDGDDQPDVDDEK